MAAVCGRGEWRCVRGEGLACGEELVFPTKGTEGFWGAGVMIDFALRTDHPGYRVEKAFQESSTERWGLRERATPQLSG